MGRALDELAARYPGTKFVRIVSTDCIPKVGGWWWLAVVMVGGCASLVVMVGGGSGLVAACGRCSLNTHARYVVPYVRSE